MKVLIIGGSGLISTGIVKALLSRKASITVYNRGKTESRLPVEVTAMHGDRNEFAAFERFFADQTFDAVIDMICFNPEQAESDVRAFAGHTGHFIFCSTVCTYGNTQTIIPTPESARPHPHSGYGKNKLLCEEIFLNAATAGKFPVTIMRPSHTFGPGGSIINNLGWGPDFVDRLRKGLPIIVSGDGHGLWQSAFCDDVGVGFAHAIGRPATFGEVYNIVGRDVFTWDQYTQRTAQAIAAPAPKLVHVPTDVLVAIAPKRYGELADIFRYHGVYSNHKIYRDVPEYKAATPYEDAVRETVKWMDAHQKNEAAKPGLEDKIIAAMEKATAALKAEYGEK